MFRLTRTILIAFLAVLVVGSCGYASELTAHQLGVQLSDVGDYDWWYGCSPTSAGMMLSKYDRTGYDNIVPGATADLSTYAAGPNYAATVAMIASPGHIADFYGGGYLASGDDVTPPFHSFNSLADFMGTSQDSVGSVNGSTWFYFYTNGSPLNYYEMPGHGIDGLDGAYGIYEYLAYAGYGASVTSLYSQYVDTLGLAYGFTFAQYMAEIDAGRPVMIHVDGHSMLGLGYEVGTQIINLYDTWSLGPHSMTWGGSYSGLAQFGVTVLNMVPVDQRVPEPAALVSLITGLALLGGCRFRRTR